MTIDYPLCVYYNRIIHIVFARMLVLSLCVYMSFRSNTDLQTQISFHLFAVFRHKTVVKTSSPKQCRRPSFANCPWMWQTAHGCGSTHFRVWRAIEGADPNPRLVPSRTVARQATCVSHTTALTEKKCSHTSGDVV